MGDLLRRKEYVSGTQNYSKNPVAMEVKEPNREYSTVTLLNGYEVKLTSVFYTHRLVVFLF